MITVDAFTSLARTLVRQVHPAIRNAFAADSRSPAIKADGSFVTDTDRYVEELFTREFEKALPGVPVIGEEAAAEAYQREVGDARTYYASLMTAPQQVVMDPIDGTKNFVEGRREFCVAVALTKRVGEGIWPEAGLVAIPVAGVMYWCSDKGVFQEDIDGGHVKPIQRFPHPEGRVSVNSKDRGWLREHNFNIQYPWISSGSSVHDFLGTALGDFQGSIVCAQRLWDLMAPLAIAEQLGCELRDFTTHERVTSVTLGDLSGDLVNRPWGFTRRMMLLPQGRPISTLISP